jgi:NADH-quinone oxidoreductase subunit F
MIVGVTPSGHVGYIYIRGEYILGASRLEAASARPRGAPGYLGENALGSASRVELYEHRGGRRLQSAAWRRRS